MFATSRPSGPGDTLQASTSLRAREESGWVPTVHARLMPRKLDTDEGLTTTILDLLSYH